MPTRVSLLLRACRLDTCSALKPSTSLANIRTSSKLAALSVVHVLLSVTKRSTLSILLLLLLITAELVLQSVFSSRSCTSARERIRSDYLKASDSFYFFYKVIFLNNSRSLFLYFCLFNTIDSAYKICL